jgi:hypothetical protein
LVIDALDAFAADQYSPKMTMVSQPSNGRVEIAHDRSAVTYVPGIRYGITGIDAFTYTITDSAGHAYTEQVTVRTPFYPAVGSYDGLVSYSTGANAGNPDGYLTLSLLGSGRFTGKLKLAGFSYVFAGAFSSGGAAKISIARPGQPPIRLTLTADLTAGDNIAASITAGGVVYTANTGARDPYSFTGNPTPSAGTYTVMLPAPSVVNGTTATATATVSHGSVTQITVTNGGSGYVAPPGVVIKGGAGLGAAAAAVVDAGSVTAVTVTERGSHYSASSLTVTIDPPSAGLPQGTGWATMTVSRGGAVTAAGKLGDGTAFSVGAFVHPGANETFAFYAPLAPGSVIGTVTFEDLAGSDCDSTLAWVKTAHPGGAFYPGGFTTSVSFVGARYAANPDAQVLEFTNATSGTALFNLTLDDQNIVSRDLLVSSKNAVTVSNPGPDELRLMINPATGTFTGTFLAGPARAPGTTAVSGVIYQKTNIGAGLFLDNGRAGDATLTPQ